MHKIGGPDTLGPSPDLRRLTNTHKTATRDLQHIRMQYLQLYLRTYINIYSGSSKLKHIHALVCKDQQGFAWIVFRGTIHGQEGPAMAR